MLFYGQTILAPSEEDEGKLRELSSPPIVVPDLETLRKKFLPLDRVEVVMRNKKSVVSTYEKFYSARGEEVEIERVLNAIYILRGEREDGEGFAWGSLPSC